MKGQHDRLSGGLPRHASRFAVPEPSSSPSSPSLFNLLRRLSRQPPRREIWPPPGHAAELDCLRGLLPPGLLASAEARAVELGVGADQVLMAWNAIDEATYITRLGRHCGVAVENFRRLKRTDCPLADEQLTFSANHMLLPVVSPRGAGFVQAPRGLAARQLTELCRRFPHLRHRIRLATRTDLARFLMRQPQFADEAAHGLATRRPDLSAERPGGFVFRRRTASWLAMAWLIAAAIAFFLPLMSMQICGDILSIWFLLFNSLRLAGAILPRPQQQRRPLHLRDSELPVYSILVALYREGSSIPRLLQALTALDYPPEKLDIKLIIEPDDAETPEALQRLRLPSHVQVIVVPTYGPRTKPKALNYALPFARGSFVTVFDAEDEPDPGQLRAALTTFRDGPDNVACVQASLCIDNTADGLLARMFTAEYAGQFDGSLQGMSQLGLPLPLGGSSNHFRTDVLRKIGGWDAHNVTEDADLGVRMARFGYRAVMFNSTTYEEAPARFRAWLRQRTRWTKGWMQTWSVHMRSPRRFWRDSGPTGFATLNLLIGGNILTALAYPVLLISVMPQILLAIGNGRLPSFSTFSSSLTALQITAFVIGSLSSVAVNTIGLGRRGLMREAWVLVLTPAHWACLSIAAWRALFQLMFDPYRWEKTEHGLARSSRRHGQPLSSPQKYNA